MSEPVSKVYVARRTLVVWTLMVVFTCVTWTIGTRHTFSPTVVTVTVLAIAFVKVRFVGADFMELHSATRPLARSYDAYVVIMCAALVATYFAL